MGKRIFFPAVAFLVASIFQGCCCSTASTTPSAAVPPPTASDTITRSAKYFWDVVATPIYGKRITEAPQAYKLQVTLKEKKADGTDRAVVNLPAMKATYNDPAIIEIDRPDFSLTGCVSIHKNFTGDIIHYTFETRKKDLILKEDKCIPVSRS